MPQSTEVVVAEVSLRARYETGHASLLTALPVELFDADGVKAEATSLYANHWPNGEPIVLDCYASPKERPVLQAV